MTEKEGCCSSGKNGEKCSCPCHKMNGILVALLGLNFLLGALDVLSPHVVSLVWPTLVILLGLKNSIGKGKCTCCKEA